MLLTEWVAFKDARENPVVVDSRLTASDDSAAPQVPSDLPSASPAPTPAATASDADLPSLPETEAQQETVSAPTASDNIVRVYTDTLQLAIDLRGGDIVEVALPEFLADIDNPDIPFVLLESGTQRTYVAQSGLIGRDGIDSNGRAQLRSDRNRYDLGDADELSVDLAWAGDDGLEVTKRFTFHRGSYLVDVDYIVSNGGAERWQGNLFGQIKRDSSPAPKSGGPGMGVQPFLGAATTTSAARAGRGSTSPR